MIWYLLYIALFIRIAHLQTISLSMEESSPFQCDSKLVFKCVISGIGCCNNNRAWKKNGKGITPASDPKYTEELFASSSFFTLTINDFSESDLGDEYSCHYSVLKQSTIKVDGSIHCNKCGGFAFLWGFIGVGVAFFICFILVFLKVKPQWTKNKLGVISVVSIVFSLVVTCAIAIPISIVKSLCLDTPRLDPLFILLGLVLEILSFFFVAMCFDQCSSDSTAEGSDNSTRLHHVEKKAEKKERAQNVTHLKTEGSSKLDDVPRGRPLPQLKDISHIPASVPAQNNTIKLDPIDVSAEKKKKKKKKKKQADGEENVGFDE